MAVSLLLDSLWAELCTLQIGRSWILICGRICLFFGSAGCKRGKKNPKTSEISQQKIPPKYSIDKDILFWGNSLLFFFFYLWSVCKLWNKMKNKDVSPEEAQTEYKTLSQLLSTLSWEHTTLMKHLILDQSVFSHLTLIPYFSLSSSLHRCTLLSCSARSSICLMSALLQEMSILLRDSDFSIFEEHFFLYSSVSSIEPWIKYVIPRVLIPADFSTELGTVSVYGHILDFTRCCCLLPKSTFIILWTKYTWIKHACRLVL